MSRNGTAGFAKWFVTGRRRAPRPAQRIIAFILPPSPEREGRSLSGNVEIALEDALVRQDIVEHPVVVKRAQAALHSLQSRREVLEVTSNASEVEEAREAATGLEAALSRLNLIDAHELLERDVL